MACREGNLLQLIRSTSQICVVTRHQSSDVISREVMAVRAKTSLTKKGLNGMVAVTVKFFQF